MQGFILSWESLDLVITEKILHLTLLTISLSVRSLFMICQWFFDMFVIIIGKHIFKTNDICYSFMWKNTFKNGFWETIFTCQLAILNTTLSLLKCFFLQHPIYSCRIHFDQAIKSSIQVHHKESKLHLKYLKHS